MSIRLIKQLILSICGLAIMLFFFGSITFAWVTMAQINNIEGINISASAGDELQISLDGINYVTHLDEYPLTTEIRLKDVTSFDGRTFYRGAYSSFTTAQLGIDYMGFDLHFRTLRNETGIFLVNKPTEEDINLGLARGTYVTSNGVTFVPKVAYTEENNVLVLPQSIQTYYAKDAVRISMSELDEDHHIIQTIIYDPSENPDRGYGTYYGAYSYFIARTSSHLDLPHELPNTTYRLSLMDPYNPYQALDNQSLVAIMKDVPDDPYMYAKVRVYLWIEGWDADAIDGIINDVINVQLEFKLANPA